MERGIEGGMKRMEKKVKNLYIYSKTIGSRWVSSRRLTWLVLHFEISLIQLCRSDYWAEVYALFF